MILGFTGTRHGLTYDQTKVLDKVVRLLVWQGKSGEDVTEANHGDCVEGDSTFHIIATIIQGIETVRIWPPKDPRWRAWNDNRGRSKALVIEEPLDYLPRDHKIVARSHLIIACPKEATEQMRGSGTWATWREAGRKKKDRIMIFPDGTMGQEFFSY